MKRFLTLLFLFTAFLSNAQQNNLNKITGLESTTASVAYSLRQLSTNYTGPLVRIKVVNSFYDVYPDATTTKFSLNSKISAAIVNYNDGVAAAGTSALSSIITSSTNATVAIWYDQSGNGVHVLTSNPNAKIITAGSINTIFGQPTIYFSGSNSALGSSSTVDYSALSGATVNAVAQNIATTSGFAGIIGTAVPSPTYPGYNISYSSSSGYGSDGHGCFYGTSVTSTDIKVVTNIFINTTTNLSKIYVNSVLKTNTAGTSGTCSLFHTSDSKIFIGVSRQLGSTNPFIGNISEAILFPGQLSDAVRNPLETNQSQTYLGPAVTIASSASGAVCAGTSVTFTATTYNFTGTPTYQWTKNGATIPGATSSTYTTTTLSNNDQIKVYVNGGITNANIVSNGLKLNLDASNPGSYAGAGNTWYDLSGNNNHATLMNSPTYDAASGSIVTNGTNQYLSVPLFNNSITNVTMQTWVYINTPSKGVFIANGYGNGYNTGIGNYFENDGSSATMLFSNKRWISNTGGIIYTSGWHLVTMVLNGSSTPFIYIDNALQGSSSGYPGEAPITPTGYLTLGAIPGDGGRYYAGKFAAAYFYDRALSLAEIQQNYNAFATKTTAYSSTPITVSITGSAPILTVTGDGCVNKTTLSTPAGLTSYAWYKDNAPISGAISNTYSPTTAGEYKVQVTSGTCSTMSAATTIAVCGVTADGRMQSITTPTTLVSQEGGVNFGTGVSEAGKTVNATGLTTTLGTIGETTAVVSGVISSTNALTSSIGVIYSTDSNFGTFSTSSTQSNVASGTYAFTLSGLSSTTPYYAKSFIVNKAGTSYGAVISFTTLAVVPPTQVALTRASVGTAYGTAFTTQPQVTIQDVSGNTVTSSSAVVTATISAGGALVGTTTATASSGVATFSNLGIKGTATAYTITYTVSGLTPATQSVTPTALSIGSTGPGGGKVFYAASSSGFACGPTLAERCYYLEVAPASANSAKDWSSPAYDAISVPGGTPGTAIGSGYQNTMAIIAQGNGTDSAAGYAQAYRGNGLSDWYLGTRDELYQIYVNRANVITGTDVEHGFAGQYWASEQDGSTNAWNYLIHPNPGGPWSDRKEGPNGVRPIRSF